MTAPLPAPASRESKPISLSELVSLLSAPESGPAGRKDWHQAVQVVLSFQPTATAETAQNRVPRAPFITLSSHKSCGRQAFVQRAALHSPPACSHVSWSIVPSENGTRRRKAPLALARSFHDRDRCASACLSGILAPTSHKPARIPLRLEGPEAQRVGRHGASSTLRGLTMLDDASKEHRLPQKPESQLQPYPRLVPLFLPNVAAK